MFISQGSFGEDTAGSATAEPETETYGLQVKEEINKELAKVGETPIPTEPPPPPPPPPRENFAIGGISLLVIAFLLLSSS